MPTVESVILWFDLAQRRPIVPPEELFKAWNSAARTDDYEAWQPHQK